MTGGRSQEEDVQWYNLLCASDLHRCNPSAQLPIIHQPVCPHCSLQTHADWGFGPTVPALSAPGADQPGTDSCSQRLHRHLRTAGTHCDEPGTKCLGRSELVQTDEHKFITVIIKSSSLNNVKLKSELEWIASSESVINEQYKTEGCPWARLGLTRHTWYVYFPPCLPQVAQSLKRPLTSPVISTESKRPSIIQTISAPTATSKLASSKVLSFTVDHNKTAEQLSVLRSSYTQCPFPEEDEVRISEWHDIFRGVEIFFVAACCVLLLFYLPCILSHGRFTGW